MNGFLKRNFVLVLGVSLPLLLVAALLLTHGISRMIATKPAYPVLYVSFDAYFGQRYFDFEIDEAGRLRIGFRLPEEKAAAVGVQPSDATLAMFDVRSGNLATFPVGRPEEPIPGQRIELDVPEALAGLVLSGNATAPDGYRLELSAYRGGGLLRELFGTGGRSRHHRLVKDGVSFRVPDLGGTDYAHQDEFVGWVLDGYE